MNNNLTKYCLYAAMTAIGLYAAPARADVTITITKTPGDPSTATVQISGSGNTAAPTTTSNWGGSSPADHDKIDDDPHGGDVGTFQIPREINDTYFPTLSLSLLLGGTPYTILGPYLDHDDADGDDDFGLAFPVGLLPGSILAGTSYLFSGNGTITFANPSGTGALVNGTYTHTGAAFGIWSLVILDGVSGGGGGGGGGGSQQVRSYVLINRGAMYSAEHSGMYWGHVVNRVNQAAVDAGLQSIFEDGFESGDVTRWSSTTNDSSNSSSLLRYLAFMQDENMSYKVALGLADPVERTIEVNMVDTLSAQTGTNFNGQTMAGGLPYAMMGVPMMPMAGGVATVKIVEAAPSGKTVIDDAKSVIEADPMTRWELFAAGDFGLYDQDQLTDLMEAFDTETYAGSIGLRYRLNDWLKAGFAWSYVESDTNASGNLGNMDLDGNMATVFTSGQWKQNWFELLYSYGSFNNEVRRNTGLGSTARGDTDSDSNNVRIQIGHNIQGGNNILHGPVAGFRYGAGDVDPYSESGGGSAALDYDGSDFESSVSRVGWQVSHVRPTGWGRIVSQLNVAWEHEFTPENGTVSGSLQTSPFALVTGSSVRSVGGFSTSSDGGAHPGTDWMSAGAGLRFVLDNGFSIRTDYEGAFFRSNASQHYASAKVSYEW